MSIFFVNLLDHGLDIIGLGAVIYLVYRVANWRANRNKTHIS